MSKTVGEALKTFYSGFGIPAYPMTSVPQTATFPYITYNVVVGEFGHEVNAECNIWMKTESESIPNAKAEAIANAIGRSGKIIPIDGGFVWLKKGNPVWQAIADEDNTIKRRYMNIVLEFLR